MLSCVLWWFKIFFSLIFLKEIQIFGHSVCCDCATTTACVVTVFDCLVTVLQLQHVLWLCYNYSVCCDCATTTACVVTVLQLQRVLWLCYNYSMCCDCTGTACSGLQTTAGRPTNPDHPEARSWGAVCVAESQTGLVPHHHQRPHQVSLSGFRWMLGSEVLGMVALLRHPPLCMK